MPLELQRGVGSKVLIAPYDRQAGVPQVKHN